MPTITLVVSSRYPVNASPRGIECCCLSSFRVLVPSLGEMSDEKVGDG